MNSLILYCIIFADVNINFIDKKRTMNNINVYFNNNKNNDNPSNLVCETYI